MNIVGPSVLIGNQWWIFKIGLLSMIFYIFQPKEHGLLDLMVEGVGLILKKDLIGLFVINLGFLFATLLMSPLLPKSVLTITLF
jgi:hypothetical protein